MGIIHKYHQHFSVVECTRVRLSSHGKWVPIAQIAQYLRRSKETEELLGDPTAGLVRLQKVRYDCLILCYLFLFRFLAQYGLQPASEVHQSILVISRNCSRAAISVVPL